MLMRPKQLFLCALGFALVLPAPPVQAQNNRRETVARPLTEKQRRRQEERLRRELERPFRKWLDEDVAYIISPEERAAFKRLQTAEEMEQFIEQFWLRRDPTPDTTENEYKEEHYRRIAYANERFASGFPGWKMDRGRIYITFGPPDEIEDHPGGSYVRPYEEGGGTTSTYPFQVWRYRWIEGIGNDVLIEFVDTTMTGEYHMTMDPSEKDALLYVPGAGLTYMEQLGLADKADRFTRTDGTRLGIGDTPTSARMNQFERLRVYAELQKPPPVKFKDLEAAIDTTISYNLLPMDVRVDYLKMTNSTILTSITLQFDRKDLQFESNDGVSKAMINVFMRITSMARRVVDIQEEVVGNDPVPTPLLAQYVTGSNIYNKQIPLAPGTYRLNIVAKDVIGGNMNKYEVALRVPYFEDDELGMSSLILADLIEKVPSRSIGTGQFVIGTSKVRPRMKDTFKQDEKMGIYLQLYNFGLDENNKPKGSIRYEVVRNGDNKNMFDPFTEQVSAIPGASAAQTIVEKVLPLDNFAPGEYTLRMHVTDEVRGETLDPEAVFTVL